MATIMGFITGIICGHYVRVRKIGRSMEDKINSHIDKLTPYKDINEILQFFTSGVIGIFGKNLTGIYLTGSLSYGAFHYDRSDIDTTVILNNSISPVELEVIKNFHKQIETKFNK